MNELINLGPAQSTFVSPTGRQSPSIWKLRVYVYVA